MAHAHKLNDHDVPPVDATDPASAGQMALLIELVRPISELAELILAQHAMEQGPKEGPMTPAPASSVSAALDKIDSLDEVAE